MTRKAMSRRVRARVRKRTESSAFVWKVAGASIERHGVTFQHKKAHEKFHSRLI